MAMKFFRCACGKLHAVNPSMFHHETKCSCGRVLDTLNGTSRKAS